MIIKSLVEKLKEKRIRNFFIGGAAFGGGVVAICAIVIGVVMFNKVDDPVTPDDTDIVIIDGPSSTPLGDITDIIDIDETDELDFSDIMDLISSDLEAGETAYLNYPLEMTGEPIEYEIVAPTDALAHSPGSILMENGNYAIIQTHDDILSLKYFGAAGDGVTDDTEAIKSALSFCKGKTLTVPSGTYVVSSAIDIPSNITIEGEGQDSMFIAADGYRPGKDLFRARTKQNITIDGVCFDGNSDVNTREMGHSARDGIHMMDLWDCTNVCIKNCYYQNNVYCAIRIVGNSSDLSFYENKFTQVDCGIETLGTGTMSRITICNNVFDGHQNSEPISFFGKGSTVTDVLIDNNIVINKTCGNGIYVGNGGTYTNFTITNNYLSKDAVGICCVGISNLTLTGNTVEETSTGGGIKLVQCSDAKVYENVVARINQNGFYIKDCSDIELYNNTINNCGMVNRDFFPMDIRGYCSNVNIYSNTFEETNLSLSQYSVACRSTGSVTISDNYFTDSSRIWLAKESSGVRVSNRDVITKNDSKTNNVD